MAYQRNKSRKRTSNALLAFSIACGVSLAIPNLRGEPPETTTAKPTQSSKVKIRFQEVPSDNGAVIPEQQSPRTAKVGKLTDAGKAILSPKSDDSATGNPLTFATDDEKKQKIATDWKDPWAVFFITGKQSGYIEPCGCTGLENQKGGLSRRDSLLTSVRKRGWNVVPIDGGNQVKENRKGRQSEIKYEWSATAMKMMEYQATTFGVDDLLLGIDSLLLPMLDDGGDKSGLFVSANVSVEPPYDVKYKTFQVNGRKIGLTAFLGDDYAKKVRNATDRLVITPAVPSLKKVTTELANEKCDYLILIAHSTLEEARGIAKAFPEFSLVITSGGDGEPTYRPDLIEGTKTQMVQVGIKGMYVGLFGLFDDPEQPFRYQRIALSSQFDDSPRMTELFGRYQDQLKAISYQGLGLRPLSHPTSREFVGSEKCGECHTTAYDIWKKTPHAHATDSIVQPPQRTTARHFDPECLACHVTGWQPLSILPYRTGFDSLETTPHMVGNGCENCHGPGAKHSAAELGELEADKVLRDQFRAEMRLPLDKAQDKCHECHDHDNSPDFHKDNAFEEYWEKVKHYGKD